MKKRLAILCLFLAPLLHAQVPNLVNYQGRVAVGALNFNGSGQFKFALVGSGANNSEQATATATRTGSFITSVTVTNGGTGYTSAPAVSFSGGGGTGASATTTIVSGTVTTITMGSAGSGYNSAPSVAIAVPPPNIVNVTYWSNNGTSIAGSEPTAVVTLPVTKGLYSVLLGDTSLANMTAIPASVFNNSDVRLRVWFNDGTNGSQLLTPDQRLAPNGYLSDGSVSSATLAGGAVTSAKLAAGLTLSGTTIGTFSGNGSALTNLNAANLTGTLPTDYIHIATPQANMVWIREGSFAMGSPSFDVEAYPREFPQTSVTISRGFWMGIYEVTQSQYQGVVGSNPSFFAGDANRPVELVSWNAAVSYCSTLTISERTAARIPATWAYRLPTEAEREYAARAGSATRFNYGDDSGYTSLTNYAWYEGNSGGMTHPVGQKAPNAWGLFDMYGNVAEWCQDAYPSTYPGGSIIDPLVTAGSNRVGRGGGWGTPPRDCRSALRNGEIPAFTDRGVGFRVVLSPVLP